MSAEKFFQVLLDSQLYRAFPRYYQSSGPSWVLAVAVVCWISLLYQSLKFGHERWKKLKEDKSVLDLRKELLIDPKVHLALAQATVATLTVLVPMQTLRLKHDPTQLLQAIDVRLDSLYDLTPVGVQFVVNYLFWATIFSLMATLSLWIMAHRDLLFEMIISTVTFRPRRFFLSGILLIPLLILGTVLYVEYLDPITVKQQPKPWGAVELQSECQAVESVKVVQQNWKEVSVSTGSSSLSGELIVHFPGKGNYPTSLALRPHPQLMITNHKVSISAGHDPLDIVIFPMLDISLRSIEKKFAADVLRGMVSYFDLGDDKDRIWLFLSTPKGINVQKLVWANSVANEIYTWLMDINRIEIEFSHDLNTVIAKLPDEPVKNPQTKLEPLVILFRWYPYHEPELLYSSDFYNELSRNKSFRLWIIDLVTTGHHDFESKLDRSRVTYLDLFVPPTLVDPNTWELNTRLVLQQFERQEKRSGNESIGRRIEQLRPTRKITFETTSVLASQDSDNLWLSTDTSSRCDYRLDLSTIANSPFPPDEGVLVSSLSAIMHWAAIWGFAVLYPVGISLAFLVRLLSKLRFDVQRHKDSFRPEE